MVHLNLKEMKAEFKFIISLRLSLRKEWISSHFLSTFCVQEAVNRTTTAGLVATLAL